MRELCSFARNRATHCRSGKRHVRAHSSAYALIHVYTWDAGRKQVHGSLISLQEYINDAATSLGITALKTEQQEAIRQFVLGRDVFVSLPTGYGKSVCYFPLPFVFDRLRRVDKKSIVVVVSPLVAP